MARESHLLGGLGGLELNDGQILGVVAHTFAPAQEVPELVGGADSEGVVLARTPKPRPMVHEITVRVMQQSTADGAAALVATIIARLAEAARRSDGLPYAWTPQGATTTFTAHVVHGQVTEVPIAQSGDSAGWLKRSPVLKLVLTCKPYWYLPKVMGDVVTSSDPIVVATVSDVTGDVDAEGDIVVTDDAGVIRRHVEWGLESRYLDPDTDYAISSGDLIVAGYSGSVHALAGAIGGTAVRAVVSEQVTSVCGLPELAHVGRFKVRARLFCTSRDARVRLLYRSGDGRVGVTAAGYVAPLLTGFMDVDLGEIIIGPAFVGAQAWDGRIDSYSVGEECFVYIDEIWLIPVERYGIARAKYARTAGVVTIRDEFDSVVGQLHGEAATLGGVWATSGSATDWTDGESLPGHLECIQRATTLDGTPRLGVLGAALTRVEVGVAYRGTSIVGGARHHGVVARFIDASNYLRLSHQATTSLGDVWLEKVVSGVSTLLLELGNTMPLATWHRLRLIVFEDGFGTAEWLDDYGNVFDGLAFSDPDLKTGGALASGQVGIIDMNDSALASTRSYDAFYASVPEPEMVVVNADKSLRIRHDGVLREGSGDRWGEPWYRGDRCLIPPAGIVGRPTRVAVKARADDIEIVQNSETGASVSVQINYTPRFRMPARVV